MFSTSTWPTIPNLESYKKPATPSGEQKSHEISSLKYRSNISLKSGGNKVFFHGLKIRHDPGIVCYRSANILPWRNWSNPIIPGSLCANPRRFQRNGPMDILNFQAMDFIMKMIRFDQIFDLTTQVPDLAWVLLLGNSESCGSWVSFCERFLVLMHPSGVQIGVSNWNRMWLKVSEGPEQSGTPRDIAV